MASKSAENTNRVSLLPTFLTATILIYLGISLYKINYPVTGYLHSWNQITTLVLIKQITNNPASFTEPKDVVTRVSWQKPGDVVDPDERSARFTIYEEFPLYHLLSAALSNLTPSLESGGRLISLLFYLLGSAGLYSLAKRSSNTQTALFTLIIYYTSFPFLYYGQAVMSDMAMTASAIWGINFLNEYTISKKKSWLFAAATAIAISGLFKSYGIVLALCIPYLYLKQSRLNLRTFPSKSLSVMLVLICSLPTIAWHTFAFLQGGIQEFESHSLSNKISFLLNLDLYSSLIKFWFRYLGHLVGGILLVALLLRLVRKNKMLSYGEVPWWFPAWGLCSFIYLAFTADKLINHDYYFLLVFPPFFFLGGQLLSNLLSRFKDRTMAVAAIAIALVFIPEVTIAKRALLKATTPNPDVIKCAELINSLTDENEFIATLTDISRYNSISFYSNRLAINVEGDAFPLTRYKDAGASVLLINLPTEEAQLFQNMLLPETAEALSLAHVNLVDFRGRARTCAIYPLQ